MGENETLGTEHPPKHFIEAGIGKCLSSLHLRMEGGGGHGGGPDGSSLVYIGLEGHPVKLCMLAIP